MKGITITLFISLSKIPGVLPQQPQVLIVEPKTFRVR